MEVVVIPGLVKVATAQKGARSTMAGFVLLAASACVRVRHLPRTRMLNIDGDFIMAKCEKGKARKQGIRIGYNWAARGAGDQERTC